MIVTLEQIINETNYPSGEFHLQVESVYAHTDTIVANIVDFNGLIKCVVVNEALRGLGKKPNWVIPFMPFARDDRRNSVYDCSELAVATDIVRGLDAVLVDPHSDVSTLNIRFFPQKEVVREFSEAGLFVGKPIVAIPDAGAAKKVYSWADRYDLDTVQCLKKRDPNTGKLSGFEVNTKSLYGRNVVIVDDICDGGATFLGLADALKEKGAGRMRLAVTHGLFTKGLGYLAEKFFQVYTIDTCKLEVSQLVKVPLNKIIERRMYV